MHTKYMQEALRLANLGLGHTSPNPAVGAVVVASNGTIIGRGYHQKAGEPHAEVHALHDAGTRACGATIYVTLEPCCIHGKTPPCTEAIIAAGIAQVVYAADDPNPRVAGRSRAILEAAGISVISGIMADEATWMNRHFNKHITCQAPFVTLKSAITLDGKIALANGASRWITGAAARHDAHRERGLHDAIAVGIGTVLSDDPLLTCRDHPLPHPDVIVFDSRLRTPLTCALLQNRGDRQLFILTQRSLMQSEAAQQLRAAGAMVIAPTPSGRPEIRASLQYLYETHGICSVLVEGGAGIITQCIQECLFDEVHLYLAPKLFGNDGIGWNGMVGVSDPARAPQWRFQRVISLGDDVKLILVNH
ncbi:bifunctional diaminohydroxyphosphoribosylaminopyrimidine deaminase/5-amino-6-(5-phosphoribosylamino)uracil reductase RibD [Chrysiogenes arsenatis]|uniref:bifunctional diaminohydroxyphosphoribosylaminopyrimidine deaminase/5-amino-6-(5-phosphoribosylamino)uracil reductase RibD n=1 Tax=Chrysiogenes arsenatis TaxID=309797 RepID=UPI000557B809|nr:bifunctional diaminohydroxyphosphoribosylaminopyrimidine deaminase/5-amino-6-(5-phosphoribosylamino)uracil reductase RibD [Chrysiogenes arsenatis]